MSLSPELLPEAFTWDTSCPPRKSGLVPKPDSHQYESAVKAIDREIASLEQEVALTKGKLRDIRQGEEAWDWELTSNPLFVKRKKLEEVKDALMSRHAELTRKCRETLEKQTHTRLEDTTSPSLYDQLSIDLEANRMERKQLTEQITGIYSQLEDLNASPLALPTPELDSLRTQCNSLKHTLEARRCKKKQLVADYKDQEQTYREQQRQLKHLEQTLTTQKRLREQEERRRAERLRDEEASKSEKDVQICEGVVRYLERLMTPGKAQREEEEKPLQVTEVEAGLELVVDKKVREAQEGLNWFRNVQTKAKKKRERKAGAESPGVQIPVEMLSFLAAKGVKIPGSAGEIPGTIQALGQWKAGMEESKRSPKKSDATEDSASVKSEDFPCLKGFESPRLCPEDPEERKDKPYRGRRGKRGRGSRYRESRKGSEPLFSELGSYTSDK